MDMMSAELALLAAYPVEPPRAVGVVPEPVASTAGPRPSVLHRRWPRGRTAAL